MATWWDRLTGKEETNAPAAGQGERRSFAALQALELGAQTASGVSVTPGTSLTNAAVFACVRVLAETVASLPLLVYERQAVGKRRAPEMYLYGILHDRPNDLMTAFELRETLMGHVLLWGNAYCEIEYDGRGRVKALWPLQPDKMLRVGRVPDGRRAYQYQFPDGEVRWMPQEQVWHLRGLGSDGLLGYSPIQLMRQTVGLTMAAEEYGARFFGNNANPGGVLEYPGALSDEAYERLMQSWQASHGGLGNAHRTAILEDGVTWKAVGMPPQDAQFLETRRFQTAEVARIFRVPPHMIGDLDRATFSNIEHQSIDFVVHSVRPWLVRLEQSIAAHLMLAQERKRYFPEFLVDGLLRGDIRSRYEAYSIGRQNGWLSANDVRELENMNPLPDGQGEAYLVPLNMVPADQLGALIPDPSAGEPSTTRAQARPDAETRARSAAAARQRLMLAQMPVFEDALGRVLRREANDIGNAYGRLSLVEFRSWLFEFFEEHTQFIYRMLTPAYRAYAALVGQAAADEVDAEVPELDAFVNAYLAAYAARHIARSSREIDRAMAADEPAAAMDLTFERWRTERPGFTAQSEANRANNAIAKAVYTSAAVGFMRWVNMDDSCPYCRSLDGTVIPITGQFLHEGEQFQPDGAEAPLNPGRSIGHPPAHQGCDCMIVAAKG